MKQLKYISIQLTLCCVFLSSCDKYLDITPKGKTLLTTVAHYDQWMNSEQLMYGHGTTFAIGAYLTDLVDVPNITNPPIQIAELMYTWAPQFSNDLTLSPTFWGEHYSRINLYNTLLLGINDATGGTNGQKRTLRAEALLGRALEYFYLVNEYAQPYDSATAKNDLAVPFVTSNDVTQDVPARSTVDEIYKHIINDLTEAIPDLPLDNSTNRMRGSVASAYSLLARVYFYARNYTEARKYAQLALDNSKAVMIDFNGPNPATNILSTHVDVIFGRMVIGQTPADLNFMRSFAANDLRVKKFYLSTDGYRFITRGATVFVPPSVTPVFYYVNTGTSVQEMKLIIAEAAARAGELPTALQALDDIRKNRFPAASYVKYTSTDPVATLSEVLLERIHELPFNGLRWLDMRRLDKENRMGTVTRLNAAGNVIATLEPHSPRYTLQIPLQVTAYHPDMPQNP
ncbi:RagB/SusD family nutrient uptake outer membrane protein [Chitinophaga sp. SYP-B3965]|uniref:RagB/SusD family nutrient uptake outer membrane protein n=1 Tax=Chitinophaga sp. SYP-B3965 TaxID=2663120 RepID=UPI001299C3C4|nr:RagB/SusD family nutrient uptake outer membrane protein [Chitinophaga sp. SYP-B3965]MRG47112.1 RagB/SusD family nutrient uptake outer membrane protein [Chitinophaga sp. SYP-B3965]